MLKSFSKVAVQIQVCQKGYWHLKGLVKCFLVIFGSKYALVVIEDLYLLQKGQPYSL